MAPPEAAPQRVIAVLGMHRSGTSCLAGSLQELGLEMGEVHTWNPYNRRGNREHQPIVDFHDRLLADNGGAWDRPPTAMRWQESDCARARQLLAGLGGAGILGFKDPRTLLVVDGWRACLPQLEFVGVFRHPQSVARSLAARSGMAREQALLLWQHYNGILLRLQRELRFPLVDFDVDEGHYLRCVSAVAAQLGLRREPSPQRRFFDAGLRSAAADGGALPYRLRLLHWRLRRRSIGRRCRP